MEYEKTGKLIQELRKEKGLTQAALADRLGVTDRAVSKWERGRSFPDVSMLKPLAEALDVSVSELLDGERRSPDKMKSIPDDAVILTVEDADKAAMTGIHTYIHETQKRERIWIGILVAGLLAFIFAAGYTQHVRHLPVNFQEGDLEFSEVRVVMEDKSVKIISLDDPQGEQLKFQLQNVLRREMPKAEEMGELYLLPAESGRNVYIKLEGLVTLYKGVYYDQRSYAYYTFPDIKIIYQKICNMCSNYLTDMT